jgi:hypothetical protein
MDNKINVHMVPGTNEVIIREGKAPEFKYPEKINVSGVLFSPADYMENKLGFKLLNPSECHLIIDIKLGELVFHVNAKDPHSADVLTGKLKRASVLSLFGINEEKFYADKELAKFFRKAEYYFSDSVVHKKVVDELMKFKAKIDVQLENMKDNRGNVKQLYERVVESNIPEKFVMKAPLFEGYEPIEFTVLIGAEADTTGVQFFLESPELFKLEEEEKRRLIGIEVERFKKFGCAILHK